VFSLLTLFRRTAIQLLQQPGGPVGEIRLPGRGADVRGTAGAGDAGQRVQRVPAELPGSAVIVPDRASADRLRACMARSETPGRRSRLLVLPCFAVRQQELISAIRTHRCPAVEFREKSR
jgi:hypothetical protein